MAPGARGKKRTQAAREALAARRSSQQTDKRALDPESEDNTMPIQSQKRIRSGTLTKPILSDSDSPESKPLFNPALPETQPRPRPKPRPKPRISQTTVTNQPEPEQSNHALLLDVMDGVNIVVMPTPGGFDRTFETKQEPEQKPNISELSDTAPGFSGCLGALTKTESESGDSDPMIVEGDEDVGWGNQDVTYDSDNSTTDVRTHTVVYRAPAKAVALAQSTWSKDQSPNLRKKVLTSSIKQEHDANPSNTADSVGEAKHKHRAETTPSKSSTPRPKVTDKSLTASSGAAGKTVKQATKVWEKVSDEEASEDEDTWNRDADNDDQDDTQAVFLGESGLDEDDETDSVVALQFEVPRGKGVRVLDLDSSCSYETFCEETSDILECSTDELQVGYCSGKAKDLKGKLTYRVIENKHDYDEMVAVAVRAINSENTRYQEEKLALERAAMNAKGKRGAPSKKTAAPVDRYVIKLSSLLEAEGRTKKGSKKDKKATGLQRAGGAAKGSEESTTASKTLTWFDKLQSRRHCGAHKVWCAVIPGSNGQPGRHVELFRSDLLLWADFLGQDKPGVTMNSWPKSLNLDSRPDSGDKKAKKGDDEATPESNTSAAPSGPLNPLPPPLPLPLPHPQSAYPPWYYPPPGYHSPYPAPGMYTGHLGLAPAQPLSYAPPSMQPPNNPTLTIWLPQCDTGLRGEDQHNFQAFLPAFNQSRIIRLGDVARFPNVDELIKSISDYPPKMPYGTAARLLEYAKADFK